VRAAPTRRRRYATLGAVALAVLGFGCTESIVAPGRCPGLCPSGRVQIVDTTYTGLVVGDSSFRGYVNPSEGVFLLLADRDSLQSAGVALFSPRGSTWYPGTNDTAVSAGKVDSVRISLYVLDRDTAVRNVRVLVYRLPADVDTGITLPDLQQYFVDSLLVDSLPLDSLLADSVSAGAVSRRIRVGGFDTIPETDTGVVALGFAVRAASPTTLSISSADDYVGTIVLSWYVHAKAPRDTVTHVFTTLPAFDTFVYAPAPQNADSALVAGGLPSARTILRFSGSLPPEATDSLGLVRATLILTPTRPASGRPGEVFRIAARGILRDNGAKSVIFADTSAGGTTVLTVGDSSEIHIEIGRLLRVWGSSAGDSLPRALMLLGEPDGLGMGEVSVSGHAAGAAAPRLRITYVRPYAFGVP
jgi:hypothetical protein